MRKLWAVVFLVGMLSLGSAMAWAQAPATWTDPATGLMWAKEDNGSDVTWNQASNYCSTLRLAGHSNWRLATIDELAGIYDQTQNVNGWHINRLLKMWDGSART